jgi:Domain of Unknown Function (DUF1206)
VPDIAKLETFARLGFAARGVMYCLIGWIALRTGTSADGQETLDWLSSSGGGIAVVAMALGFAGYGLWRIAEAAIDSEGHGSDAKGFAVRTGGVISGLVHLALAVYASRLFWSDDGGASGGASADMGAQAALDLPGGTTLILLAAIAIIGTGLYQFAKAIRLGFLKQMDPAVARQDWLRWIGRAGYAARGATFLMIGWLLFQVWQTENAGRAGGIAQALDALPRTLFLPVAIGLGMFGLFSFVEARYRRIADPQVIERLKRAVQ